MRGIVTAAPKSVQLAGIIRREIEKGKVKPGERLLPIRAMAEKFKVSHQVAQSAFGILSREGLLEGNLGRGGTYVSEAQETLISKTIISMIETDQGSHAQFVSVLPRMLVQEDYMPAIYESGSSSKVKESIRNLIRDVPKAVIVDGTEYVPYDILDDISPETHLVFINRFEGKKNFDASYVLSDYSAGASMAVRHLLGLGRKKIMIITSEIKPGWTSETYLNGCIKTLDEAGLEPAAIFICDGIPFEEKLVKTFSSKSRPDGILSFGDSLFLPVEKFLRKARLKMPDDVAMISYFNTPWADALDLTSLSIRSDFISAKAVEAIKTGKKINLKVKPEFVFRGSCPRS